MWKQGALTTGNAHPPHNETNDSFKNTRLPQLPREHCCPDSRGPKAQGRQPFAADRNTSKILTLQPNQDHKTEKKTKTKKKRKEKPKEKQKDLKGLHYEKTLPLLGGETHVPWRDQAQKLPQGSRMFPRRGPRPLDPRNQLGQISKKKEERKAKVLLKSIYHLCVL